MYYPWVETESIKHVVCCPVEGLGARTGLVPADESHPTTWKTLAAMGHPERKQQRADF